MAAFVIDVMRQWHNALLVAMDRRDGDLYPTLLNEQHRVSDFALHKDILITLIIPGVSPSPALCEPLLRITVTGPQGRFNFLHGVPRGRSVSPSLGAIRHSGVPRPVKTCQMLQTRNDHAVNDAATIVPIGEGDDCVVGRANRLVGGMTALSD